MRRPLIAGICRLTLSATAAWTFFGWTTQTVGAQSPACARIAQQISSLSLQGIDGGDPDRAATINRQIQTQRAEIQRVSLYMRQIGCGQPGLQFGSDASPECVPLGQRVKLLQQGVARLTQQNLQGERASSAARRQTLLNAYDSYGCTEPIDDGDAASSPDTRATLDTLLDRSVTSRRSGVTIGSQPNTLVPPLPDEMDDPGSGVVIGSPNDPLTPPSAQTGLGGKQPVCVRLCDGFFFPIAGASTPSQAQEMCQAQCPQTQASLFLRTPNGEITDATDIEGHPYSSLPNALRYRTKSDDACTCRRADQSWGAALKPAEEKLEKRNDELTVTDKNVGDIAKGKLKVPGSDLKTLDQKTGAQQKQAEQNTLPNTPLRIEPKPNVRIIDTSKARTP